MKDCNETQEERDTSIEAKYIDASKTVEKALWMKKFIYELGAFHSLKLVPLYYDNNGGIAQAHTRTKIIPKI